MKRADSSSSRVGTHSVTGRKPVRREASRALHSCPQKSWSSRRAREGRTKKAVVRRNRCRHPGQRPVLFPEITPRQSQRFHRRGGRNPCFAKQDGKMKNSEGRTFARTETFCVATYNVENYLDDTASRCCVKSAASKAKMHECIRALHPDALALQEVGSVADFMELRAALQAAGLDFPHWEHVKPGAKA